MLAKKLDGFHIFSMPVLSFRKGDLEWKREDFQRVLIRGESLDKLHAGERRLGTTYTWQSDSMREIAAQNIQHWAFLHLRCRGWKKVVASQFVHGSVASDHCGWLRQNPCGYCRAFSYSGENTAGMIHVDSQFRPASCSVQPNTK